ncbi:MAG: MerC family mercury resistance protein [Gemmatimonadetes bacterium]|nr:MerC family mercury resistance protein [Gemmatimonadota bacterium]
MSTTSARARTAPALGWAAALPLLCSVHCLAAPLLAVLAPAFAIAPAAEHAVQLASAVLAVALAWSGLRAHGRTIVLSPPALGMGVWAAPEIAGLGGGAEQAAHVAGGLILAAGMLWNGHLRHQPACHHCGCPAHHD